MSYQDFRDQCTCIIQHGNAQTRQAACTVSLHAAVSEFRDLPARSGRQFRCLASPRGPLASASGILLYTLVSLLSQENVSDLQLGCPTLRVLC